MACVSMAAAAPRVMCAAQRSDASRRASRRGVLAATLVTATPLPARALDAGALEEAVRDSNVDILRMADPRKFMNPAEIELERELGRPTGEPHQAVGVAPGEDGERDVVTTPSGLAYADVRVGGGDPVRVGDLVVAHLIGTTADGKEFENTYARGTALTFTLGVRPPGVCEGLEEAIETMRAGGRRLAVVPAALGFPGGVRAPLGRVPAGSALRYEIQLLRCLTGDASTEQGFAEGEKICCSDENYPCDPVEAARGSVSVPEGFQK